MDTVFSSRVKKDREKQPVKVRAVKKSGSSVPLILLCTKGPFLYLMKAGYILHEVLEDIFFMMTFLMT